MRYQELDFSDPFQLRIFWPECQWGTALMGWVLWLVFSCRRKVTLDRKYKSFEELVKCYLCLLLRNSALPHQVTEKLKGLVQPQTARTVPQYQISRSLLSLAFKCMVSHPAMVAIVDLRLDHPGLHYLKFNVNLMQRPHLVPVAQWLHCSMAQPVIVFYSWLFADSWCQCKVCILIFKWFDYAYPGDVSEIRFCTEFKQQLWPSGAKWITEHRAEHKASLVNRISFGAIF